jgi:NAD(P)-dependent dehydrogenase (short-subunit alcohol dehydrogenase family)
MDLQLENKVVLITGGTSGIGLSSAEIFVREGARVMIGGRSAQRGREALHHIISNQPDAGERIRFVTGDVGVVDDCRHMVSQTLEELSGLDIVVNSAGMTFNHHIEDINEADFDRLMNTNVKGTYFVCKYAVQHFRTQGYGNIVNVSSDAGLQGNKELSAYCASKGAVTLMTKALAVDLAQHNIRVNCVCPGDIHTPMLEADLQRESDPAGYLQRLAASYPLGRLGRAEEVARVIVFLASDVSPFSTGAAWPVDGGITAS